MPLEAAEDSNITLYIWTILAIVYSIGVLLFLMRNMVSYLKIFNLIRRGKRIPGNKFITVENLSVKSAFTVLSYVVINPTNLSVTEKDLILKHELTHINQRHWIDLLCSECMLLLQWFNPLVWVYVRLLKENHEFLADKAVLDSGAPSRVYQAVLINQEFQGSIFSFVNSFNYSKPLNRLSMMKKKKSASWKRLAALAIVPMLGLFLWASAKPNYIMKDLPIDTQMENSLVIDTVKPKGNKTSVLTVKESNPKNDLSSLLRKNDLRKALIIVDGQKGIKLEDVKAEEIVGVEVLKGEQSIEKYGEEEKKWSNHY